MKKSIVPIETVETFYKKLADTTRRISWGVDLTGSIRGHLKKNPQSSKCFCPLSAVVYCETGKYLETSEVMPESGEFREDVIKPLFKLCDRHLNRIIAAADADYYTDSDGSERNPIVARRRIAEAVGVLNDIGDWYE